MPTNSHRIKQSRERERSETNGEKIGTKDGADFWENGKLSRERENGV